jgi:hypothetical protein
VILALVKLGAIAVFDSRMRKMIYNMKYKITYNPSQKIMTVKASGRMNGDDYISMAKDILKHPEFRADGNALFDHEDLDFSGVGTDDLERIRAFHRDNEKKIGSGKTAIVVKAGMAGKWYELWSQGEKINAGNKVRVFEDSEEGIEWLFVK